MRRFVADKMIVQTDGFLKKGNSVSGKRQDIQIVVSGGAVAIFVSDLKRRVQPVEIVDVAGGIQNREWSIVDLGP